MARDRVKKRGGNKEKEREREKKEEGGEKEKEETRDKLEKAKRRWKERAYSKRICFAGFPRAKNMTAVTSV